METQSLPDFTTKMETLTGDHPANQTGISMEFQVKREHSNNKKHIGIPLIFV